MPNSPCAFPAPTRRNVSLSGESDLLSFSVPVHVHVLVTVLVLVLVHVYVDGYVDGYVDVDGYVNEYGYTFV